jgi:hypothetical protein
MKVLRNILSALLAAFVIALLCLLVHRVQANQYHDAVQEALRKHKIITVDDSDNIQNYSIAQELFNVAKTNSTVNFDNYYANLSSYDREKLPEFYNPESMFLEYINGKWDGKASSHNHTLVFDDGSILSAEILFDNILHVSYDDGLLFLDEHDYYLALPEHHYNLYFLPDGTRVGSPHQPAAFAAKSTDFDGCMVFGAKTVYAVNGAEVAAQNLHFDFQDDVIQWFGFDNGVFVFVVKSGETIELWRCIRGEMDLVDSAKSGMSLSSVGYHKGADYVRATFNDHALTFAPNGNFTYQEITDNTQNN